MATDIKTEDKKSEPKSSAPSRSKHSADKSDADYRAEAQGDVDKASAEVVSAEKALADAEKDATKPIADGDVDPVVKARRDLETARLKLTAAKNRLGSRATWTPEQQKTEA